MSASYWIHTLQSSKFLLCCAHMHFSLRLVRIISCQPFYVAMIYEQNDSKAKKALDIYKSVSVATNVLGDHVNGRPRLTLRLVLLIMRFGHQSLFRAPGKKLDANWIKGSTQTQTCLSPSHHHQHIKCHPPQESFFFESNQRSVPGCLEICRTGDFSVFSVTLICIKFDFLVCLYSNGSRDFPRIIAIIFSVTYNT